MHLSFQAYYLFFYYYFFKYFSPFSKVQCPDGINHFKRHSCSRDARIPTLPSWLRGVRNKYQILFNFQCTASLGNFVLRSFKGLAPSDQLWLGGS